MTETFRYYSPERPIDPGTCPSWGLTNVENFDDRTNLPEAGGYVWGHADYNRRLAWEEVLDYELIPEPAQRNVLDDPKLEEIREHFEKQDFSKVSRAQLVDFLHYTVRVLDNIDGTMRDVLTNEGADEIESDAMSGIETD